MLLPHPTARPCRAVLAVVFLAVALLTASLGLPAARGAATGTTAGAAPRSLGTATTRAHSVVHLADRLGGPATLAYEYGVPTDQVFAGVWTRGAPAMPRRDTLALRRGNTISVNYRHDELPDHSFAFGRAGDVLLSGDWDGDGVDTFAVRRGNAYHFRNANTTGPTDKVVYYGRATDEVFVGDWDGDGVDSLAVRRGRTFYVRDSISSGVADHVFGYGWPGDEVLVGTWATGGRDSFAVRRGNVFHVKYEIGPGVADQVFAFGRTSDQVLVGNWDGEGWDRIGVRRAQSTAPAPTVGTGTIDRVSVTTDGGQALWASERPVISGDGTHVAFYSYAAGLTEDSPVPSFPRAFVRDLGTGRTWCVRDERGCLDISLASSMTISDDGSVLALASNGSVIVRDAREPGDVLRLDVPAVRDGASSSALRAPSLSGDGRWLAYVAAHYDAQGTAVGADLVLRDLATGGDEILRSFEAMSPGTLEPERYAPAVSGDGSHVAFVSDLPQLAEDTNGTADVYVLDRVSGSLTRASVASDGTQASGAGDRLSLMGISADGRLVLFVSALQLEPADTNGVEDAYLFDARSGASRRVSVGPSGLQSQSAARQADLSSDGRYVAFVNQGYEYFAREPYNMVDVFVRDTVTGRTTRASAAVDGTPGNGYSSSATISDGGRLVAFSSVAHNLVPADTNKVADIFVKDLGRWPTAAG